MMNRLLDAILPLLRCPDDRQALQVSGGSEPHCSHCGRLFELSPPLFIDLVPRRKFSRPATFENDFESRFFDHYDKVFAGSFQRDPQPIAWGAEENLTVSQYSRKLQHCHNVLSLTSSKIGVSCDISGGAGLISRAVASRSEFVLHCDLDMNNLLYAMRKTQESGIKNILFIRADFFSLPLAPSCVDTMLCFDTLIYGNMMVRALLMSIFETLSNSGTAVVDFYNRLHRNPFHKPYLMGYSRDECERLLDSLPSHEHEYFGFHQEWGGRLSFLLPATRHIYRIRKKAPM